MSLRITLAATAALALPALLAAQTSAKPKHETQAQLQHEATVTLAAATATAAKAVPAGKITSHELEREDGKLIYSFDIKTAGKSGTDEVNVDAMTGTIVSQEHESPAAEKKEAAAEAKKKSVKTGGI
jgi:uncharacterized membrane protein YkoI